MGVRGEWGASHTGMPEDRVGVSITQISIQVFVHLVETLLEVTSTLLEVSTGYNLLGLIEPARMLVHLGFLLQEL